MVIAEREAQSAWRHANRDGKPGETGGRVEKELHMGLALIDSA